MYVMQMTGKSFKCLRKIIYLLYFARMYWALLPIYECCGLCHVHVTTANERTWRYIKASLVYQGLSAIENWTNTTAYIIYFRPVYDLVFCYFDTAMCNIYMKYKYITMTSHCVVKNYCHTDNNRPPQEKTVGIKCTYIVFQMSLANYSIINATTKNTHPGLNRSTRLQKH